MADFADNDIQELLQQAEQRLSGGRIVAKEASTASTATKPAGEEDAAKAVAVPTPELAQVRVPQPKLDAQRKGKVSRRNKTPSDSPS